MNEVRDELKARYMFNTIIQIKVLTLRIKSLGQI